MTKCFKERKAETLVLGLKAMILEKLAIIDGIVSTSPRFDWHGEEPIVDSGDPSS